MTEKTKIDVEEARQVIIEEANKKQQECIEKVHSILEEYGFALDVKLVPQITIVPKER